jgi:hypothetical protein
MARVAGARAVPNPSLADRQDARLNLYIRRRKKAPLRFPGSIKAERVSSPMHSHGDVGPYVACDLNRFLGIGMHAFHLRARLIGSDWDHRERVSRHGRADPRKLRSIARVPGEKNAQSARLQGERRGSLTQTATEQAPSVVIDAMSGDEEIAASCRLSPGDRAGI